MPINGLPPEMFPEAALGGGMADATSVVPSSAAALPDVEYLTSLANAMFAQLPGGLGPVGALPVAPQLPASPESVVPPPQILPVDVPLAGAPGVNSTFRPSAHGAPFSGPARPVTSPSAVPLPGEGELRALLSSRLSPPGSVPAFASAVPGSSAQPSIASLATSPSSMEPSSTESLMPPAQILPVDVPLAGAPGVNSTFRPSAHGAPFSSPARPVTSPSAVPLPGEAELRALLSSRLSSPGSAGTFASALPGSLARPSLHGAPVTSASSGSMEPYGSPAVPGSSYYFLDESRTPHGSKPDTGPVTAAMPQSGYDVYAIRRDFPILDQRINGHPLIWLDNGATTQKPQAVIDRLVHYYSHENSNVHRGAHELAARATDAYEDAREKVRRFLGASSSDEIVFARGATEAINLVAQSWGRQNIGKDEEIVITWLEHHANIVPWQQLCTETGARLKVVPVDDHGQVLLDAYEKLLGPRTKLVSFTQVSNALGTVTPAKQMVEMAHRYGAMVLIDGAQAVSHMRVNVQELDCDWYAFSGHKVFAPTGIGVLYGRKELLDSMPPWQGGGNMIKDVTFERTEYQDAPVRFEAGTGSIADAVGLGAAIDYLGRIGMENVARHEHGLMAYATKLLSDVPGLRIIGTAAEKAGVISFVLAGQQSEGVGSALNEEGIAVRSGHHCAQPILRRFGLESTVRPSFALYNTYGDIDALAAALRRIQSGHNPLLG